MSEKHMGAMTPPSRKSCYNFRVTKNIDRVLDGDTIDVTIDLGFDSIKRRVRVAGVDTPEKRTRDLEEKELGIHATVSKEKLDGAIAGDDDLVITANLLVVSVSTVDYSVGETHWGDSTSSLNEQMIEEGYAWRHTMVEPNRKTLKS